jgi:hypothetical protein
MTRATLAVSTLLFLLLLPSRAVIVAGGDGTQNTTAPVTNDFGFANVGLVFDTVDGIHIGGVYLGNGWMISAYHGVRDNAGGFLFGNVILEGNSYAVDAHTATRLTTAGSPADLVLFRLAGPEPNLPSVSLSGTTPPVGANLAMAGNGRNRAVDETHWNVTGSTWTITPGAGDRQGYFYLPGATKRWGNNLRAPDPLATLDGGFGPTTMFRTTFNNEGSDVSNEAQAAPGDSGGGVFYFNGTNWELAGIMLLTTGSPGQPGETAVFGNQTLMADIATYRDQIVPIVPEPSAAVLIGAGVLGFGARRRRHACCASAGG